MEIGLIGFGRMGRGIARRLTAHGHKVLIHDVRPELRQAAEEEGLVALATPAELTQHLSPPRRIWLMIPHDAVDATIALLTPHLAAGDVVVDGGNSYYRDTLRRAAELAAGGIHLVDVGVSGGVHGEKEGYCLMAGGEPSVVEELSPIFAALAQPEGFLRVGPVGAGHFVKMVHNGIEYGLLEAYAEGFALLTAKGAQGEGFHLDRAAIARLWQRGSVIRSWLLELAAAALADDEDLSALVPVVADSGEGRWTVEEAVALGVPVPAIASSLFARFASQGSGAYAHKFVAALRHGFGGHPVARG